MSWAHVDTLAAAVLIALQGMTGPRAPVPTPKVSGPIPSPAAPGDPSRNYPFFSTKDLVEKHDYVEEEYFVEGLAFEHLLDGQTTAAVAPGGPFPYNTRVIVRRPKSPRRFNGIVILEWINAVATRRYDFETDWNMVHEHLMRRGFAHAGVSAQAYGIDPPTGLKAWNPARYGSLDVTVGGRFTNDELSFAIFSQVAQALKTPSGPGMLGGLEVRNVIATGQSASAVRLTRYYNSVHPLDGVIDGFVLHGPIVGGAIRTDLRTPAWKLLAETDVIFGQGAVRQPDSDFFRTWEVAGTSHLDVDTWYAHDRLRARDLSPIGVSSDGCERPTRSRVPARLVQEVVYDWMRSWVEGAARPPHAPPIALTAVGKLGGTAEDRVSVVARDQDGNALGGIRLAQFAVAVATNAGWNDGPGFCRVSGSHEPFHRDRVARLYPTAAKYIAEVDRITAGNLKAGYITREGAALTRRDAARWKGPGT
jgi:hypothetical protein